MSGGGLCACVALLASSRVGLGGRLRFCLAACGFSAGGRRSGPTLPALPPPLVKVPRCQPWAHAEALAGASRAPRWCCPPRWRSAQPCRRHAAVGTRYVLRGCASPRRCQAAAMGARPMVPDIWCASSYDFVRFLLKRLARRRQNSSSGGRPRMHVGCAGSLVDLRLCVQCGRLRLHMRMSTSPSWPQHAALEGDTH